ncbi:MAG: type II toxin-antitoxin system RelE/ParE family toxin [Pseudomonadales bacterium]|nr:type II toxin-antitoxin system RelE/ParE family toxin [Pseudomonadales bacterium]
MVVWSPRARADLKDIHDYIAEDSPINAKKVVNRILEKAEFLTEFPTVGKMLPEVNNKLLREINVQSWRVIYHIRDNNISIVTVIHKRRHIESSDI